MLLWRERKDSSGFFWKSRPRNDRRGYESGCASAGPSPLENLYQAAIYATTKWGWNGGHQNTHEFFRGERNRDWSSKKFTASIYRNTLDQKALDDKLQRLAIAAHWFRERFPDRKDADIEIVAILQRYVMTTWLLDISTSVYAALYFASGEPTGIGTVYAYSKKELESYHKLAPELVPPVKQIKPHFVPRIDRQYGLFLEGGHGWAIRHMVIGGFNFKQVPGMQFQDHTIGVTKEYFLDAKGDWAWFDSGLTQGFAAIDNTGSRSAIASALDALLSDHEDKLKASALAAPPLKVNPVQLQAWPPDLEALRKCAARCFAKTTEIKGISPARAENAASAVARYHHMLCEDPACTYFLESIHAYIDAAHRVPYELFKKDLMPVDFIAENYFGRADSGEDKVLLGRTLDRFKKETGVADI